MSLVRIFCVKNIQELYSSKLEKFAIKQEVYSLLSWSIISSFSSSGDESLLISIFILVSWHFSGWESHQDLVVIDLYRFEVVLSQSEIEAGKVEVGTKIEAYNKLMDKSILNVEFLGWVSEDVIVSNEWTWLSFFSSTFSDILRFSIWITFVLLYK